MEREERIQKEKNCNGERKKAMEKGKLEMEEQTAKEKLLFQEKEKERKEKEKERRYQLRLKELEMQEKTNSPHLPSDPTKHFNITKHIRLVPLFQEKEVNKYFLHFEKVAENTLMCLSIGTPKNKKISICSKWKIHYFKVSQNQGKLQPNYNVLNYWDT